MLLLLLGLSTSFASVSLAPSESRSNTVYSLGIVGDQLSVDLVSSFISSAPLTLSISGLKTNTGLVIDASGKLVGKPTAADLAGPLPLMLTVKGTAPDGSWASFPLLLSLLGSKPQMQLVPMFLRSGNKVAVNASGSFSTLKRPVVCAATGLPQGSGLRIDPASCLISGSLNAADAGATQPLLMVVTGTDAAGKSLSVGFAVTVIPDSGARGQTSSGAAAPSIALANLPSGIAVRQLGVVGRPLNVDMSNRVKASGAVTYEASGLPPTSGLSVTKAGRLIGNPNAQDLGAKQPVSFTVAVKAADGTSVSFPVFISVIADPGKVDSVLSIYAYTGVPINVDIASGFDPALVRPLSFTATGLPAGSGVSFDSKGVLSGSPNGVDAGAAQPLQLDVVATDSAGTKSTMKFVLTVILSAPPAGTAGTQPPPTGSVTLAPSASRTNTIRLVGVVNQNFSFSVIDEFVSVTPVILRVAGLPAGSGLSLNGPVLSGRPNQKDLAARQPLIVVVTAIAADGSWAAFPIILPIVGSPPSSGASTLFLTAGSPISANLSATFSPALTSLSKPIVFSQTGLPANSGVVVNSSTGVVSGSPNAADSAATQPLRVTLTATSGGSRATAELILVVTPPGIVPPGAAGLAPPGFDRPLPPVGLAPGAQEGVLRVTTVKGVPLALDMKSVFLAAGPLRLDLAGLPTGSGIGLTNEGLIAGQALDADVSAKQPMVVVVTATAPSGESVSFIILLSVLGTAPVESTVVPLYVVQGVSLGEIPTAPGFDPSLVPPITYKAQGLPANSGLSVEAATGVVRGTPNEADLNAAQPVVLSLSAIDSNKKTSSLALVLTVTSPDIYTKALATPAVTPAGSATPKASASPAAATPKASASPATATPKASASPATATPKPSQPTPASSLPPLVVRVQGAKGVTTPLAPLFPPVVPAPSGAVSYFAVGLPTGTGLVVSKAGVLSGVANNKDLAAKQPIRITLTAADAAGTKRTQLVLLAVLATTPTAPQIVPVVARQGAPITPVPAPVAPAPASFSLTGLPVGSGLKLDAKTGALSGQPTEADTKAAQPIRLVLSSTDAAAVVKRLTVVLVVLPPQPK